MQGKADVNFTSVEAYKVSPFFDDKSAEYWISQDCPNVWVLVESRLLGGYMVSAHINYGYGNIQLRVNNQLIKTGKYEVCSAGIPEMLDFKDCPEIVLLDRDYHGCSKYIWI